jgi:hypothetical protein
MVNIEGTAKLAIHRFRPRAGGHGLAPGPLFNGIQAKPLRSVNRMQALMTEYGGLRPERRDQGATCAPSARSLSLALICSILPYRLHPALLPEGGKTSTAGLS